MAHRCHFEIENKCSELGNSNYHQYNWIGIKTANIKYKIPYHFFAHDTYKTTNICMSASVMYNKKCMYI